MVIERLLRWRLAPLGGILLCIALAAAPVLAAKPKIGITSLVVKQVQGTSENLKRRLSLKDAVFQDEFVETGVLSASEMRFIDDTRITVGPSSSVVLDKFVYDPDPGKGAFALRMTEGVFRFFSGKMDSTNYSIDAPSVTVGVRGTIIVAAINPADKTFVVILESTDSETFVATHTGETAVVDTPGKAAIVLADGSVSVGDPPAWAILMIEGMDRVISWANLTVPEVAGEEPSDTAALLPPPPDAIPPGAIPPEGNLRGLPRAAGNQDPDSQPSGLGTAVGQANEHASDPDGGPGGGNNGSDSSGRGGASSGDGGNGRGDRGGGNGKGHSG